MLRATLFNQVAELYDKARPGYPTEIVEAIVERSEMPDGGRILEIGCGTGQITLPFAGRDYTIVALEPGDATAAVARRKLNAHPNVAIIEERFETWSDRVGRVEAGRFDLVLSAQAFHWVDPETSLQRAAEVLRPDGSIALVWNMTASRGTPFWNATEPIYDRYIPDAAGAMMGTTAEYYRTELARSPLFHSFVEIRQPWSTHYSAGEYIDLLNTYSDHRAMPEETRARFMQEIRDLIEREFGGEVERKYETMLLMARRRSQG